MTDQPEHRPHDADGAEVTEPLAADHAPVAAEPAVEQRRSRWQRLRPRGRLGKVAATVLAVVVAIVVIAAIFMAGYMAGSGGGGHHRHHGHHGGGGEHSAQWDHHRGDDGRDGWRHDDSGHGG